MKLPLYAVAAGLGVVCLAFNMLALGAAARAHPAIAAQARAESPLAQTYIVLDRYLRGETPYLAGLANGLANAAFGAAWPAVEAQPELALDSLYADARGKTAAFARAAYWGAPILLLLALVLYVARDRQVRLISTSGR